MVKKILHLSHTDIRRDSRILKEIGALEDMESVELLGMGVRLDEGSASTKKHLKAKLLSIRLYSKSFRLMPRAARYAFNLLELTVRMLIYGLQVRPRVVHCHDTLALPAGVLLQMLLGCRLVYDAHELESDKNGQSRLLSDATLQIEKWAWKKIDLLVSVSESINLWYVEQLGPIPHLLILNSPEALPLDQGGVRVKKNEGKYFHDEYNIPAGKLVFIYVGILGHGRGIDLCLDVFADPTVDAHVVFMGYGPLAPKIRSLAGKHNNIHLHQPVPHEEVILLTRNADIGLCFVENVSLSDYYCLPNKLFEYAFSGIPVLASDFPEMARLVKDYSLGFCSAVERDAIRAEVLKIIEGPLPSICRNLTELSWPAQADKLRKAYNDLLV